MTEEKIEINDTKSDIVRTFFLVKILECTKNVKIILFLKSQAYDAKNESYFLASLPAFFDKIISFREKVVVYFSSPLGETIESEKIKSDCRLFLSDQINLVNLGEIKKSNLEYLGSGDIRFDILPPNDADLTVINSDDEPKSSLELIETSPYIASNNFDLSNCFEIEIVNGLIKVVNESADVSIRTICSLIQSEIQKQSEDLDATNDIQLKKQFFDSLKAIQSIMDDLIKTTRLSGKEYVFFSTVCEKMSNLLKNNFEGIKTQLEKCSFFYNFFIRVRTDSAMSFYVKLQEWLFQFENVKFGLEKRISETENRFRERFKLSLVYTKEIEKKIKFYYANILAKYGAINPGHFMEQLNYFKAKYYETLALLQKTENDTKKENWLKLVETLNENFLKDIRIGEVKLTFELKTFLNATSSFEMDLINELRDLEKKLASDYPSYLNKCIFDLKKIATNQFKEYINKLEIVCKKEKNYKFFLNVKVTFENFSRKKENFKDFVASLQYLPQIQEPKLLDIVNILEILFGNDIFRFSCDEDLFKKEFDDAVTSIEKIINSHCETLWKKLVLETKSQLEESFKEIKSIFQKISSANSNKTIEFYQKLSSIVSELNLSTNEPITYILKVLRKNLIDDQSLDEKIIITQVFNKLEISEFLNEHSDTKSIYLKSILDLKQVFETSYSLLLRERLNFVWSILAKNVESLKNNLEKRYAFEAKNVIEILMEFAVILGGNKNCHFSIVQVKDKILAFEECFAKNFSFLTNFFEFNAITTYLIELLKNYNAEEIKIEFHSYKESSNKLNLLVEVLKVSDSYWVDSAQFLSKTSLISLKNDIEEKIQKENLAENYNEVREFCVKLLGSLDDIKNMSKDVTTFSSLILDKIGFFLTEETRKHFELILKDTNEAKFILKELDKIVITHLKEQVELSKKNIFTKEENLKAEKIKKCFTFIKNDIELCLKELKDDQKCLAFLLSLLDVLHKIKDWKSTKNMKWLCLKLSEFWKSEKAKGFLDSINELDSQEFLEEMSKEYFIDRPIPEIVYGEIANIYEVFKTRTKNYEDSIKQKEEDYAKKILEAVSIFEKEINEFIKIQGRALNNIINLVDKIREASKSNKINEISRLLIFDFEPLIHGESSRRFEDLQGIEIAFVNQTSVKKSIKKILNDVLDNLNKIVKELEIKGVRDTAHSIATNLVNSIDELLDEEIEKPSTFSTFLDFLVKLKMFFEKITFEKINKFASNLLKFSLEFKSKIDNLELIEDKDLLLYPHTQKCLNNLRESIKFRLNWYRLVKIIFEKMNKGYGFDIGSQNEIKDTENLQNFLRTLKIQFENSMFSNWSQSLSYDDFEKIKNSELSPFQKIELQILTEQVFKNSESHYDPVTKKLVMIK